MTKQIWLNLPVKDIGRSKEFFTALDFSFKENRSNATMLAMMVGDNNFPVMLFEESAFKKVVQNEITDTILSSEILISVDAQSREEVDQFAQKVTAAGGDVFAKPAENQGWMYGCAFSDPDGHRWNVLYMDMEKMPK